MEKTNKVLIKTPYIIPSFIEKKYKISIEKTSSIEVQEFRYINYIEKDYIKENKCKIDIDEYDKYSIHFSILNKYTNEILIYSRLIKKEKGLLLPIEKEFDIRIKEGVEISRFILNKKYRGTKQGLILFKILMNLFLNYFEVENIEVVYAILEDKIIKLLDKLNFNFIKLKKESKFIYNTKNYATCFYLK